MYKSEQLNLRLSPKEAEIVETLRGALSKSAWVRSLIVAAQGASTSGFRNAAGDALTTAEQERPVIESPLTEQPIVDMVPTETISHRHKRGKVIGEHFEKGQKRNSYRCAVDGCTYVMVD